MSAGKEPWPCAAPGSGPTAGWGSRTYKSAVTPASLRAFAPSASCLEGLRAGVERRENATRRPVAAGRPRRRSRHSAPGAGDASPPSAGRCHSAAGRAPGGLALLRVGIRPGRGEDERAVGQERRRRLARGRAGEPPRLAAPRLDRPPTARVRISNFPSGATAATATTRRRPVGRQLQPGQAGQRARSAQSQRAPNPPASPARRGHFFPHPPPIGPPPARRNHPPHPRNPSQNPRPGGPPVTTNRTRLRAGPTHAGAPASRGEALHLRLRRRPGRGRRVDARPARRQGRRPGGDDERRACPCRPASRSRPRPATTTSRPASSCPTGLWDDVLAAVQEVEQETGKGFGDADNPLLVSVRSGAKFSMPGMMDTVLNLGPQRGDAARADRADGQRALRLGRLPAVHPDVRAHRDGRRPARRSTRRSRRPRRATARSRTRTSTRPRCARSRRVPGRSSATTPAASSRPTRTSSSTSRSRPSSRRGSASAPATTASTTRSPTTSARRSTS